MKSATTAAPSKHQRIE